MARYIYCPICNMEMATKAACYDELYESVKGTAIKDMFCDGCIMDDFSGATPILKGEECYAAVLLDNEYHPNYKKQHLDNWAHEYINLPK